MKNKQINKYKKEIISINKQIVQRLNNTFINEFNQKTVTSMFNFSQGSSRVRIFPAHNNKSMLVSA